MQTKHLCVLIHIRIRVRLVPRNYSWHSSNFFTDSSRAVLLLWTIFVIYICLCHTVVSVSYSLEITCWERADLLALLHVLFSCVFVTFPNSVLGQVWYLNVSIPDLCLLSYFGMCFSILIYLYYVFIYQCLHFFYHLPGSCL